MSWAGRGAGGRGATPRTRSLTHLVRQVAPGGTLPRAVPGTSGTGTFPIGASYCNGWCPQRWESPGSKSWYAFMSAGIHFDGMKAPRVCYTDIKKNENAAEVENCTCPKFSLYGQTDPPRGTRLRRQVAPRGSLRL